MRLVAEVERQPFVMPPGPPGRPILFFAGSLPGPEVVHLHQGMELGIAVDDEIEIEVGGSLARLKQGGSWLTGMWEPHRLLSRRNLVATFQFLPEVIREGTFPELAYSGMFAAPPPERPHITAAEGRKCALDVVAELCREVRSRRPLWDAVVELGLLRILLELRREWEAPRSAATGAPAQANAFSRIIPAVRLLKPGLGRRVSAREAADACNLSMAWFHTLFRSVMGVSFGEFSLRSRVGFAARQLLASGRSVHAIAQQEGFTDASHLHRCFVRCCGCTPSHYREQRSLNETAHYDGVFWQYHQLAEPDYVPPVV